MSSESEDDCFEEERTRTENLEERVEMLEESMTELRHFLEDFCKPSLSTPTVVQLEQTPLEMEFHRLCATPPERRIESRPKK
jgi:TATA-binding protein-associated factor Taf7